MDKLGLYLLVSLFFVMATMIEFVIVLLVYRNSTKNKVSNKLRMNDTKEGNVLANHIDVIASIAFPLSYLIFNIGYWNHF